MVYEYKKKEYAMKLLKIDPHSPATARINGALAHIEEFYETYNVKEGDGMYLAKDHKMNIW
uniref:Peptidase M13 C-terminal domain-containing protein n=1 Tax=viral metagenome TaxID=1070528 RepID=A0A6C0J8Y0_9ZZZZ